MIDDIKNRWDIKNMGISASLNAVSWEAFLTKKKKNERKNFGVKTRRRCIKSWNTSMFNVWAEETTITKALSQEPARKIQAQ